MAQWWPNTNCFYKHEAKFPFWFCLLFLPDNEEALFNSWCPTLILMEAVRRKCNCDNNGEPRNWSQRLDLHPAMPFPFVILIQERREVPKNILSYTISDIQMTLRPSHHGVSICARLWRSEMFCLFAPDWTRLCACFFFQWFWIWWIWMGKYWACAPSRESTPTRAQRADRLISSSGWTVSACPVSRRNTNRWTLVCGPSDPRIRLLCEFFNDGR